MEKAIIIGGGVLAIALRCLLATQPHSGEGVPPLHGDYEAQRHWLEITSALPVTQWYVNSTDNDLLYWGLDYPPLTAYHSLGLGLLGHKFVPECFELHKSRGIEQPQCRLFMRLSVIFSDLLIYFPGVWVAVSGLGARDTPRARAWCIVGYWLLPPLLLIDHGHFQYNGVCFGLCLAAAGLVAQRQILAVLLGSILFTLGLLFKQIALYYAFAFFFFILSRCWHDYTEVENGELNSYMRVLITGYTVIATVGAALTPWLLVLYEDLASGVSPPLALAGLKQVLHRVFPLARGLYEDKVANFWCSISVVFKLHRFVDARFVPMICAGTTLLALLPACAALLRSRSSTSSAFVAALVVSSLSFFLFAFQVHEKGILFPVAAVCLLPISLGASRPPWLTGAVCHFCLVALFSMYPLVVKDKLQLAYVCCAVPLIFACEALPTIRLLKEAYRGTVALGLLLHWVHGLIAPPARLPDLWTMLITGSSCAYFMFWLAAVTAGQLRGAFDANPADPAESAVKEKQN